VTDTVSPVLLEAALQAAREDPDALPEAEEFTLQMVEQFPKVFAPPTGMPPVRNVEHVIELEPGKKIPRPRRVPRFSLAELETIRAWLDDMLQRGWLEPSRSPWGAPILCVRKPGGGLRVVQDMRALNSVTKKATTPLPLFDNLVQQMSGCSVFSVCDLSSFYFQIRLRESDKELTAIATPYGLYQFTVMSMGLTGTPSTALMVMQDVLRDALKTSGGTFIDDIIMHTADTQSHMDVVRRVLQALADAGLHLNLAKCLFLRRRVKFLGHFVGTAGLQADPARCAAISTWPRPRTVSQLRSFLGLASYYRRFVPHFATVAAPLTALLTEDSPFTKSSEAWGPQQVRPLYELKHLLTSPPVLRLYQDGLPLVLRTDASDYAMGAVLYQRSPEGDLAPLEYKSKSSLLCKPDILHMSVSFWLSSMRLRSSGAICMGGRLHCRQTTPQSPRSKPLAICVLSLRVG